MNNHDALSHVTKLSADMFSPNVETLIIPDTVTEIEMEAFCRLPMLCSLSIGKSVNNMGPHLFVGSNNLTNIEYRGTMKDFEQIKKDAQWIADSKVWTVTCIDGVLPVGYDYERKKACEYLSKLTDEELEHPEEVIESYHRNKQVLTDILLEAGVILSPKYRKSLNKFEII